MENLIDYEELLDGFSTKLKDFDTKEYIITPKWLKEMLLNKKDFIIKLLSEGNQSNSKPANCAIFDVSGSLPTGDKIRETSNMYARNRYYEQENQYDTTVTDFEAGVQWLLRYIAEQ